MPILFDLMNRSSHYPLKCLEDQASAVMDTLLGKEESTAISNCLALY